VTPQRPAKRLGLGEAGQVRRHGVEGGDAAPGIDHDDAVRDRAQRAVASGERRMAIAQAVAGFAQLRFQPFDPVRWFVAWCRRFRLRGAVGLHRHRAHPTW
jgi:hypothetical protein